jgi:hypothetical protein
MSIAQQYLNSDTTYQGSGIPKYRLDGRLGGFARYDKDGVEIERINGAEGVVTRFSIQEFTSSFDGEEKVELEVDFQTRASGALRIVANLKSFTGLSLAEAIALSEDSDELVLSASTKVAEKKNKSGGNIIYTNVAEYNGSGWTSLRPAYTGEDKEDRLDAVRSELSGRKLYKVRVFEKESEHAEGPFGVVLEAIKAKDWPSWTEHTDKAYMEVFNKVLSTQLNDPKEFSGSQCETLVMAIQKARSTPGPVKDAIEALGKAAAKAPPEEEEDPFA